MSAGAGQPGGTLSTDDLVAYCEQIAAASGEIAAGGIAVADTQPRVRNPVRLADEFGAENRHCSRQFSAVDADRQRDDIRRGGKWQCAHGVVTRLSSGGNDNRLADRSRRKLTSLFTRSVRYYPSSPSLHP